MQLQLSCCTFLGSVLLGTQNDQSLSEPIMVARCHPMVEDDVHATGALRIKQEAFL